jgi:carboxymethylenebutenolidase
VTSSPLASPLVGEAATLQTPWLGLFGDKDKGIPVADVEALRDVLDATNPVDHDIVRYDADTSSTATRPAVYDAWPLPTAGAERSRWFDGHLRHSAARSNW